MELIYSLGPLMLDHDLIQKYDVPGPRYTSYPTALAFDAGFDAQVFLDACAASDAEENLSLYVHIPFCESLCYYCACNKIISKKKDKTTRYIKVLAQEIKILGKTMGKRPITQLHFGGGTPTYFTPAQMEHLLDLMGEHLHLLRGANREYSIEVDPRSVDADYLQLLARRGLNRISFGIQDFAEDVQQAINRPQSYELCRSTVQAARDAGFMSVAFDLVYGLPAQTHAGFEQTLELALTLAPDRIALFNYAHLPAAFKAQRLVERYPRATGNAKLAMMFHAMDTLRNAGYQQIGMDHFALPNDGLALAANNGTLQRNFQGYSTESAKDLIGLGVSSISAVNGVYAQNARSLKSYYRAVEAGICPVEKGYKLNSEDLMRQSVILSLLTHMRFDFMAFKQKFAVDPSQHFARELAGLQSFQTDGLIAIDSNGIQIQETGRQMVRNVAMVFDQYLSDENRQRYSRTV